MSRRRSVMLRLKKMGNVYILGDLAICITGLKEHIKLPRKAPKELFVSVKPNSYQLTNDTLVVYPMQSTDLFGHTVINYILVDSFAEFGANLYNAVAKLCEKLNCTSLQVSFFYYE